MRPVDGKVAIVTGASRGIGKALAERLSAAGATVVIAARSLHHPANDLAGTLDETLATIRDRGGIASAIECDIEEPASREALVAQVMDRFKRIDILVNNAGSAVYKRTDVMSYEEARSQTEQYLLGPWDLCHHVIPIMRRQGEGRILNIGSISAVAPPEGPPYEEGLSNDRAKRGAETLYASLKAAVHRWSQALACDHYRDNIGVNLLAPVGAIMTPRIVALGTMSSLSQERIAQIVEPVEHIAEAAIDILSRPPQSCTGNIFFSYKYLDEIGRSTMTLDGREIHTGRTACANG